MFYGMFYFLDRTGKIIVIFNLINDFLSLGFIREKGLIQAIYYRAES